MFDNVMQIGLVGLIILAIVTLLVYFLPMIVAVTRGHQDTKAIFILNLLLGWTMLGWIGALVWSFTHVTRAEPLSSPKLSSQSADPSSPRPELEDFVICIPQPPTLLVDAVWEINRARMSVDAVLAAERRMKNEGDWVKKGEPMALLGAAIVSPVDGKIRMMGLDYPQCRWPDGADWPEGSESDDRYHTLVKIQPAKGSELTGYINETYQHLFTFLGKFIEQKKYLRRMGDRSFSGVAKHLGGYEEIAPYLRSTMDKVRHAKPRIEPLAK